MSETPPLPDPPEPSASAAEQAPVMLSGWQVGVAWALLALLVVSGIVLNLHYYPLYNRLLTEAEPPFQAVHLNASWQTQGVPVLIEEGGMAEQAGLPTGRLIAVDGRVLAAADNIFDAAPLLAGPVGEAVALTVETAAGEVVTASVIRTDERAPVFQAMGISFPTLSRTVLGIRLVAALVFLVVGGVLLVRRSRGLVALLGTGFFWWFALEFPLALPVMEIVEYTGIAAAAKYGVSLIGFLSLFLFLATFPDGRVHPRWAWILVAFGGVALFGNLVLLAGVLVGIASQVVRYRRFSTEEQRLQTRWAVLGVGIGLGFFATGGLIFQLSLSSSEWRYVRWLIGTALFCGAVAVPIGVALSLLRYRLWDAEAAWSRSAMVAALTIVLTAVIAGGTALAQGAFGTSGPLAFSLATGAAAVIFVPLQKRLAAWADHRFLRDLTELKEGLPDLVNHLRETESVEGLADAVTTRIAPAVHATHVALAVPVGEHWQAVGTEGIAHEVANEWVATARLHAPPRLAGTRRHPWREVVWRDPGDRQFPVRVALRAERSDGEIATEGWLLLGPRPDGSGYGPDDLEAVAEVASSIGRALQVVRVREGRADALNQKLDRIERHLAALRER